MVSILIPTYNYACVNLVKELSDQMISNNIIGEIIVLDDYSNNQNTLIVNRLINDIECARFVELKQNGFKIKHIDNPVYHDDKDEDFEFLQKTYVGLNNLAIHQDKLQQRELMTTQYILSRDKTLVRLRVSKEEYISL